MIPSVFMVYCFAFEIGHENHPKENGKVSGFPLSLGEFHGLTRVCVHMLWVMRDTSTDINPLLSTTVMNFITFQACWIMVVKILGTTRIS